MGGLWAVVVTDFIQFIILTLGVLVLFPLVFANVESLASFTAGTSAGFLSPVSQPFSPLYVLAFYLLIILSYNGNWAFAQKFYSVQDERAARKAGILAVILKVIGPPLFILPAMAARSLMPELMQPPNSPQFTYAALSLKFLPAGLMGLMIAAMFSATMSTLSGDYNVMASVITEDIYRRLFDPSPSRSESA
jgi:Na+/proline symporter